MVLETRVMLLLERLTDPEQRTRFHLRQVAAELIQIVREIARDEHPKGR